MSTDKKVPTYEDKFDVLPEHVEKVPSKRSVEYNGERFFVRKNTRKAVYAFIAFEQERNKMLQEAAQNLADGTDSVPGMFGPMARYDRYNYYVDLLKFVLIGDLSIIDEDTLDMNEAEEIILAFLPESMRLSATLIGF